MIAIVNYDMGNLRSVQKGFQKIGAEAVITRDPDVIKKADGLVLPGVGAFGLCMDKLNQYSLVNPILDFIASKKPFLGICLGLQLLFEESVEFGSRKGLGVIKGKVIRFKTNGLKVPHIGWNSVGITKKSPLMEGLPDQTFYYFVHSFYVVPEEDVAIGETEYGKPFVCAIQKENVFATQFHPEKSQDAGLKMLENFYRMTQNG